MLGEAEHLLVSEYIDIEMWFAGQFLSYCDLEGHDFSDVEGCVINIISTNNDKKHKEIACTLG